MAKNRKEKESKQEVKEERTQGIWERMKEQRWLDECTKEDLIQHHAPKTEERRKATEWGGKRRKGRESGRKDRRGDGV